MRRCRAAPFGTALLALSLATLPAAAQSSTAEKVAAEALFDQGKKLMAEGKFAEACPKFAESQRLDAGIGTMLYLSDCYEKVGRTASAWASFREAESAARAANQSDRARVARERAAALEPQLSRLTINVNPKTADLPGLAVKRDGTALSSALWGSPLPVDPGTHAIEATAPGYRKATVNVEVRPGGQAASADVPALEKEAAPSLPSTTLVTPPQGGDGADGGGGWPAQKTWSLVAGGVGVAGLAVGTVFGLSARSDWNKSQSDGRCTDAGCNDEGYKLANKAKDAAGVATISFGVGALGVAGGLVLWLTAPKARKSDVTRWQFAPSVGAGTAGVQVGRAWLGPTYKPGRATSRVWDGRLGTGLWGGGLVGAYSAELGRGVGVSGSAWASQKGAVAYPAVSLPSATPHTHGRSTHTPPPPPSLAPRPRLRHDRPGRGRVRAT